MSDYPHFASPCIVRRRYIPELQQKNKDIFRTKLKTKLKQKNTNI